MDATTKTPANRNFLSPNTFLFSIKKTPTTNFFVQNVNIPGIMLPPANFPTPLSDIPLHGDKLQYDDIMINYKVDEDLKNYLEIFNWIKNMGYPDNNNQFAEINAHTPTSGLGLYSDISLIICNSDRVPKWEVLFERAFPISISSLIFDSTQPTIDYLEAAATFKYRKYDIYPIT